MRKYALVQSREGLKVSLQVLKRLRRRSEIKDYYIMVGCFANQREVGLTFYPAARNDQHLNHSKTFCIYEHRNSDQIILNGADGMISSNGELPYKSDSKYDYIGSADYQEYDEITDLLVKEILKIKS